jgi:oligoribonuclease NrnB/cAMP/cGMP phosphodiesterase (DHH superfamily)
MTTETTETEAQPEPRPPLCIYHGACRDGWCSAWVFHRRHPDAEFFAGFYGDVPSPPDCTDRDVVLLDFSYPADVLLKMAHEARSVLILDHHKTAEAALSNIHHPKVRVLFDMNRSGAGLTWDYYYPNEPRIPLVDYVEDRDLWRHALPESEVVNAYIATLPFTFDAWEGSAVTMQQDQWEAHDMLATARQWGQGALRKTNQYVREVSKNAMPISFAGYSTVIVNAPQVDISELLDNLAKTNPEVPFVMGWWQRGDGVYQYSLRSRGNFDVAEIAKGFGGGGHKNAAGFQRKVPMALDRRDGRDEG